MLEITVPETEFYNEITDEFVSITETPLQIEHSLVSVSKWESKWMKPFMGKDEKTVEETMDYVRCMTITQNVNPLVYSFIPDKIVQSINDYINAPMTASWFTEDPCAKKNREVVTSEIIYYRMTALNIPFECQRWHLNRLLTLIRVCGEKNQPPKKGREKNLSSRAALNAQRRKKYNTKG
jgi:hypothetical protein